jgi:hypothetical protein
MFDGSVVDLDENMKISAELLKECVELNIILEIEAGCVGGEEDGHDTSGLPAEKLYTTPEDMMQVYETLSPIGRFMFAATLVMFMAHTNPGPLSSSLLFSVTDKRSSWTSMVKRPRWTSSSMVVPEPLLRTSRKPSTTV